MLEPEAWYLGNSRMGEQSPSTELELDLVEIWSRLVASVSDTMDVLSVVIYVSFEDPATELSTVLNEAPLSPKFSSPNAIFAAGAVIARASGVVGSERPVNWLWGLLEFSSSAVSVRDVPLGMV